MILSYKDVIRIIRHLRWLRDNISGGAPGDRDIWIDVSHLVEGLEDLLVEELDIHDRAQGLSASPESL